MSVTVKDVEYVAKLARLEFNEAEKERLALQLNSILSYMEKLNELDTTNVEPLAHVIDLSNVVRPDQARSSIPREEAFKNAPDHSGEFFRVPKVIGER